VFQFWFMLLGMNFRFSIAAATLVMVGAAVGSVAQLPGIGGGFQALYIFCMTTFFCSARGAGLCLRHDRLGIATHSDGSGRRMVHDLSRAVAEGSQNSNCGLK
jgi:hypothetical protein